MRKQYYTELLDRFFRGQTSDEENRILKEWIGQPESQALFFEYYGQCWRQAPEEMAQQTQDEILSGLLDRIRGSQAPAKKKFRLLPSVLRYASVAACAALIAGTGVYFFGTRHERPDYRTVTMSVENGQKADVVMSDGTHVYLNSDSRLTYNNAYNLDNRTLQLEGEAFFEVARNEEIPFVVEANGLSVEALGTCFNVRAHANDKDVSVILTEGKVRVSDSRNEMAMEPGQRLEYDPVSRVFRTSEMHPNADYLLWRSNELALYGESLEEICNILTRMYNWNFVFKSESVKRYTYTGIIRNNSLENIISFISQTTPVKYQVIPEDNTIVIDKK